MWKPYGLWVLSPQGFQVLMLWSQSTIVISWNDMLDDDFTFANDDVIYE